MFPIIVFISMIGSIIATLRTPPDDMAVLKEFYTKVRPWGWWKPIHEAVIKENSYFINDSNVVKDLLNVFVGII